MTYPARGELLEGTLADLRTLMAHPVAMRRGSTVLKSVPAPAAGANLVYPIGATYYERVCSFLATFAASAAAGQRSLTLAMCDGDGAAFNLTPASAEIGPSETWRLSADLVPSVIPVARPNVAPATATFLAAGNGTATLAEGQQLAWLAVSYANVGGAGNTVVVTVNNAAGGTLTFTSVLVVGANPALIVNFPTPLVQLTPGTPITVTVTGNVNSPAGSISAYPASPAETLLTTPQLPDIIMQPGWSLQLQVTGVQAGDQISGVKVLTEQYDSESASGTLHADVEHLLELLRG